MQLYLSFFSLSKIIVLAKRVRKSTFTSIISPVDDIEAVTEVVSDIKERVSGCPTEICTSPDELDRETWNRVYLEAHLANLMEEASQSQNFPISRGKRGEAKQASKLLEIL